MDYFSKKHILEKFNHAGFQKYLKNTSWLLLSRLFSMVVAFFVGAYVARYLGPSDFGSVNYIISFVGLFSILASLGIDSILVRDLVRLPEKRDSLLGSAFIIKLIGGITVFFIVFIACFLAIQDSYTRALIIMYSLTMLLQSLSIIDCYFQANVLAKKTAIVQIGVLIFSSVLKVSFVSLGLGIGWFVFSYVIDAVSTGLGLIIAYSSLNLSFFSWKFDYFLSKKILSMSWPLILSGMMGMIYLKIDQVMIGYMLGNYSAGIYAAAVKLSEIWYFIPGIIVSSVIPAIINAKKESVHLYYNRFKKLYLLLFTLSLLLSISISFFSKDIVHIIFGDSFTESSSILALYVWAGIPVFISTAFVQFFIIENMQKKIFFTTAVGAISNIILNILFIPHYGILGAAYATLASYTLVVFAALVFKEGRLHVYHTFMGK